MNKNSSDSLFFSKTNSFLNLYIPAQANLSMHTQKQYRTGLSQFFDYIVNVLGLSIMKFRFSDITYPFILGYLQYMQKVKNLSPATVNVRITAIREYLKYASSVDISVLPAYTISCNVPTIAVPEVMRPVIQKSVLADFLDSPKHSRLGNRDRFILILLYDSAIRVEELVKIKLGDINIEPDQVTIQIHGKGRKERFVQLAGKSKDHMCLFLNQWHEKPYDPETPLVYTVYSGRKGPMSVRNVERIVTKYGNITREVHPEIPESVYPHMMRRTRATGLYQDGVPLELVSDLLGHSQIETTRKHYAKPSDEQKKAMMTHGQENEPEIEKDWLGHTEEIKRIFGLS